MNAPRRPAIPFLSVLGAALLPACSKGVSERNIRTVSAFEVRTLRVESERNPDRRILALIDARAGRHFRAGHIPGARNLQTPDFPQGAALDPELDAFEHIVVYGRDPGDASARALTKRLMFNGYDGVRLFAGGVEEWARLGWAIAREPDDAHDHPDDQNNPQP